MNTFGSGGISFCGYSYTGGLTGSSRTSSHTDSRGYAPGDITYIEYDNINKISFYNDDASNNLSYSNLISTTEYYLFMVLYHP